MRSLALALLLGAVGCGPVWMFPGGPLRGIEAGAPSAWESLDHCKVIQLETRADDPYSINIWAAGSGAQLYLASGGGTKSPWVRHIQTQPLVRVQACDTVYRMRAVHTEDERELERFLEAVKRKYDWKREQALEYRAWVFRLDPV
jgi:hypothetical protein